jgi:hypothetical protein
MGSVGAETKGKLVYISVVGSCIAEHILIIPTCPNCAPSNQIIQLIEESNTVPEKYP